MISLIFKELEKTVKQIKAEEARTRKALEDSVKIEAHRLMGVLKSELEQGRPGGSALNPLREMSKRMGKNYYRKPLSRLAAAVRYSTERQGGNFIANVGFFSAGRKRLSKSWQRIAEIQQAGGRKDVTAGLRRALIDVGVRLQKRSKRWTKVGGRSGAFTRDDASRFFFLRKSTTQFKIPARPVIEPFVAAHIREAESNIRNNFERKMAGEYIEN